MVTDSFTAERTPTGWFVRGGSDTNIAQFGAEMESRMGSLVSLLNSGELPASALKWTPA